MKTLFLTLSLFALTTSIGQTNIIAAKSHGGNTKQAMQETDNFGEPYHPLRPVDTVFFVKPGVLIETRFSEQFLFDSDGKLQQNHRIYDTIIDPSITKTLSISLKSRYPQSTVFIGFEELKMDINNRMYRNAIPFLVVLVLGFLGYQNVKRDKN